MDEAILIEIAQRFRKFEDAIQDLDKGAQFSEGTQSEFDCDEESNAKTHMEELADACRDDMNAMMDFIRKAKNR